MGMQRTDVQGRFSTMLDNFSTKHCDVTGVRGLKPVDPAGAFFPVWSHSARSAWIETLSPILTAAALVVALRKECVD